MSEAKSVKELKELIIAIEPVVVFIKKVAADKKVGLDDLPYLIDLSKQLDTIAQGADGADEIVAELKDLDEAEVMEVIGQLIKLAKAIKAA